MKILDDNTKSILVISDTHKTKYSDIDIEIQKQILKSDFVVHCGDIISEKVIEGIEKNSKDNLIVHGNSDPLSIRNKIPKKSVFKLNSNIFGVIHPFWGGPPPIDFDLIIDQFKNDNPKFILFGHTHDPHIEEYKGVTFINPGQGYSEFIIPASFCLINFKKSRISIEINKIQIKNL